MMKKLQGLALLICTFSYAAATTVAIGTASARGDMRVDRYTVSGNATLFDGSVVETGQATADLRLDKGVEITMSTRSRGTLYHDRLVLEQGESDLTASAPFHVDANNLRVTSIGSDARGVVSLKQGKMVEVAALSGSFGVTSDQGVLLARVTPGQPMTFAPAAGAAADTPPTPMSFTGTGMVSKGADGNYFLTVGTVKYQVTGSDLDKYVGKTVTVKGTTNPGATPAGGATLVIAVSSVHGALIAGDNAVLIGAFAVAGGVGAGVGVYEANHTLSPISRP